MTGTEAIFYLMAAAAVGGGLGVVLVRNVVYAALFLILTLLAVAAFYILLATEFLALVQILIYAGAVTILLLFVLMLTRVRDAPGALDGPQKPFAALAAATLFAMLATVVAGTTWPGDVGEVTRVPFESIGDALFRKWAVPFEVASLVLLVALVGAIVIARPEDGE
jgi:NADH:ubiquinone oxidoreductase subunit 6 (subunit J)